MTSIPTIKAGASATEASVISSVIPSASESAEKFSGNELPNGFSPPIHTTGREDSAIKTEPLSSKTETEPSSANPVTGSNKLDNAHVKKEDIKSSSTRGPQSETSAGVLASSKRQIPTPANWGVEDADGGIVKPHDHDVLSGRGNSVNHHPGNEYFRSLVRHHKLAYVRCPKPQKEQFSKLIVSTVRDREPPGRFLKQNPTTKLWYNIGTQKALDKTRQALREGAPATVAGLMLSQGLTPSAAAAAGLTPSQAVSTMSGDNELGKQGAPSAAAAGNNPFLPHHAAHHAVAAAAAAAANQQQHQHNAAMAAAHSRMVNNQYYNAAAAAAAAGNYPNSPKPSIPTSGGSASVANKMDVSGDASGDKKTSSGSQSPSHTPQQHQPQPPPLPAQGSYPPLPPPSNSDEAMKYHAAQVVRMAAAAHAAGANANSSNTSNGGNGGGSNPSQGSTFGTSAALAAAAGTFNPVLLEHIMAQYARGGAGTGGNIPTPIPGAMEWNPTRQAPAPTGGPRDFTNPYAGYPPPATSQPPTHEDSYTKSQRQEAYIAHLQERIQQQERQLLTLCSHILLSPPAASNNTNNSAQNGGNGNASNPHHGGISHPQFAAAAKMNAAAAVANINATAAAVKELQSYAQSNNNAQSNPPQNVSAAATAAANLMRRELQASVDHNNAVQRHAAAVAAVAAVPGSDRATPSSPGIPNPAVTSQSTSSSSGTSSALTSQTSSLTTSSAGSIAASASKSDKSTSSANGYISHFNAIKDKNNSADTIAATAPPTKSPSAEKSNAPSDDGDAVAALLALGIGKSPSSGEAASSATASAAATERGEGSSGKKKRKLNSGRRTLPLKKKQIQQQDSKNASAVAAVGSFMGPTTPHHAQQQLKQARNKANMSPMNSMIIAQNRGAVIPKPVEMTPSPELYLYGETPIHEPHVHDVLCGRGALTNEHPGNEWFRRLVRSNRQLYRSCPKHTKLLVAKAIVQAVQRTQRNPPGRFLEKTKTADGTVSNTWTPITYKSAVEKASQALREKVTPNWGAPPSNFPLSKALEAARAVAYLEKEYPSGDGFGGTNLLALIMAVVQSAGLD